MYLLKAINLLKKDFPEISLRIFGTGPLIGKIKKEISDLGLNHYVRLEGFPSFSTLITEVRKADVVVLPSLYETGGPITAFEAMACSKAPIVFDFPFSREFITDMQNGLQAKAKDAKDLSEKIRLLLNDKKLGRKLGKNARNYVFENHNWDKLVNRYIKIYESLD